MELVVVRNPRGIEYADFAREGQSRNADGAEGSAG